MHYVSNHQYQVIKGEYIQTTKNNQKRAVNRRISDHTILRVILPIYGALIYATQTQRAIN